MKNLKIIIPAIVVVIVAIVGVLLVVNNNQQEQVKGTTEVVKTTKEDKTTIPEKETSETETGTSIETTEEVAKPTQSTTKTPETTKKPTNNSSGNSGSSSKPSGSNTTTQKPVTTTKPTTTKQEYVGHADIEAGLSWDGTPIIYHYPDGTTSTIPIDGAKYEYTPGIWRVIVVPNPTATTIPADMCSFGCGRKNSDCASKMHDWHCDVCNVDVKKWECHDRH